ncbi:hypothetical protein N799_08655 [Lysobacter arseniciresistens ZS79]|uniref:Uncharacterized protein n=1 Tax=Lysobacter arseniciresistens ZS79 TaxID=913325 RepID=A0A0A0EX15_9GAMM|nr:hypothetical protein [Lysobacter arseniciresistens]KGM54810.1 hypothetical protein N799_08655 [Lysobacter arseniciresistens ZS79]
MKTHTYNHSSNKFSNQFAAPTLDELESPRALAKNKRIARLAGKQRDKERRMEMQMAKRHRAEGQLSWA